MVKRGDIRRAVTSWAPLLVSVLGMLLVAPISASAGLRTLSHAEVRDSGHLLAGFHRDSGLAADAHLDCEAGARESEEDENEDEKVHRPAHRVDAVPSIAPASSIGIPREQVEHTILQRLCARTLLARGPPIR